MYTRSLFETADMIEQHNLLNRVAELIDAGTLRTTVGEHFGRDQRQRTCAAPMLCWKAARQRARLCWKASKTRALSVSSVPPVGNGRHR
jgi:NADPH:quinone reductase-like Zn-dependent oxidoreductase